MYCMIARVNPRERLNWSDRESGLRLDKEEGAASLLVSSFLFGQVKAPALSELRSNSRT